MVKSVKLSSCEVVRLSGCQVVKLSGCQVVKLSSCQVVGLSGCQVYSLGHAEQVVFFSHLWSKVSSCQVVRLSGCQYREFLLLQFIKSRTSPLVYNTVIEMICDYQLDDMVENDEVAPGLSAQMMCHEDMDTVSDCEEMAIS